MDYNSGKLICPGCGSEGMMKYTNWTSRNIYNNQTKKKQCIFYFKEKQNQKCICFYCCKRCRCDCNIYLCQYDCEDFLGNIFGLCCCSLKYFSIFFSYIFYVAFFFWICDFTCWIRDKGE